MRLIIANHFSFMRAHKNHHFYLIKIWKSHRHLAAYSLFLILFVFFVFSLASFSGADERQILLGILASFGRLFAAFCLALLIGCAVGLLTTRNQRLENILLPIFDTLQSFPFLALLPLIMLWAGSGTLAAIAIIFISMVWPILFSIVGGMKSIKENLSEAALLYQAGTGWKHFRYFLLPALAPAIITGSIIAWGEGWEVIVGAELIGISTGIGAYILKASQVQNTHAVIAGITALLVFVFILNKWVFIPLLRKVTKHHE